MAQNIGFLNFGIDGDDKAIKAKIDALKKDAVSLEQIFKNIKIDSGGNLSKDTQKAQLSADKLAVSNAKVAQSISDMERASVRLSNEKARSAEIDSRTAVNSLRQATEKQRQDEVALNMEIRKQRVSNVTAESMARKAAIEQKMQEQSMMNEARLEGIRKRNEEIGKRGQENFRKAVEGANKSLHTQNNILTNLEKKLIGVFSTYQIARFAKEIVNVRGEFQGLELAFTTMLGSAEKSQRMMIDVTELALKTPYTVTEVASNTKQLIAMGVEADNVMQTMKALGDVSAGVSVPMWRVAINYGQVSALGRLQAREIRDFAMAGIPIVDELAKQLGKTTGEITDLVSAGKIGFPEVEKAFQSMAGEGGKFHNMMEKQNSTVKGQMNRLQDQVELMMNSIGKSNEGIIYSTIGMASSLVENYEKVGRSIVGLIATYGAYRTAVAMASLSSRGYTLAEMARLGVMTTVNKVQKVLNATMLNNPYVAVTALVVGAVSAFLALRDSTTSAEKAQKRFNEKQEEASRLAEEHKGKIDSLIDSSRDIALTDIERGASLAELRKEYPKIFAQYDIETIKLADILDLKRQINAENKIKSEQENTNELANIEKEITRYEELFDSDGNESNLADYAKKIRDLKADRDVLLQELGKDISEQFIASFKDIKIDDFDKHIKILEEQIKGKGNNAKIKMRLPIDIEGTLSNEAIYDTSDIKNFIDALKTRKQSRLDDELNKTSNRQDLEEARKKIKEAEKVYKLIVDNNDKYSSKQREQAKQDLEKAKKDYEALGGKTKETKSKKKTADIDEDLEKARYEKRKQSTDDKLELLKIEEEQELKSLEKRYKDAIVSEDKKNELINLINEKYSVQRADIVKSELEREQELWNKYLAEYGTFQQQKLAVTNEYEHKISKAKSDVERKSLEKERDSKLSKIEVSAIKSEIDWVTVFGKFGGMFKDIIADTLAKTKEYTKTDEFKNTDHASQKSVIEAINQMEKAVGGSSLSKNFKELGESVQQYHDAEKALLDLRDKEKTAIDKTTKAFNDYLKALKEGTDLEQDKAKVVYEEAKDASLKASSEVELQNRRTKESQDSVSESASKLDDSMNDVIDGLSKMSSGKLSGIYYGFIEASRGIDGAIGEVAASLESVPIVGWILSIIDIFKDGLSDLVGSLLDAIFNAVSGILSDVLSGDLFVTIGKSIASGVSKIFDAVSFGGFSSLMDKINGGNAKETAAIISKLTVSNEALKVSVDALRSEMKGNNGMKSIKAYNDAVNAQKRYNDNLKGILDAQMRYHNSHKSNSYYWDLNPESLNEINKRLGTALNNSWSDFAKLTPSQMSEIRKHLPDIWSEMINQGKYGDRFKDDWNNFADQAEKTESLLSDFRENIAQISFDGLRDNFVSSIMDMNKTAADFADNFGEYLSKALINFALGDEFDDELKKLYDSLTSTIADNEGDLSEKQVDFYQDWWGRLYQNASDKIDDINKITGRENSSSSKSTLSKGIQSITEDAGDLLASYVNAVRADVAVTKEQVLKIVQMAQLSQTSLGGMLAQLLLIQTNTFNTANNTKEIAGIVRETNNLLKSATTDGGITQFNIR